MAFFARLLINPYTIAIVVFCAVVYGIWRAGWNARDLSCNNAEIQAELAAVRQDLANTQKALAEEKAGNTLLLTEAAKRKGVIDGYIKVLGTAKDPSRICDLDDADLIWLRDIRTGAKRLKP